jgi:hypothetical protein
MNNLQIVASATNGAIGIYSRNFTWKIDDDSSLIIENSNAPGFKLCIQGKSIKDIRIQSIEGRCLETAGGAEMEPGIIAKFDDDNKIIRLDSKKYPEFWVQIHHL